MEQAVEFFSGDNFFLLIAFMIICKSLIQGIDERIERDSFQNG